MADSNSYGGVVKDPLDLRDLVYESGLFELPFKVDNRKKVPVILDQGQEGACTGFGLAAVVNYLLHNRADTSPPKTGPIGTKEQGASPRMLYEMAKRYDEWKGENYEGSSVRGAMKGWSRHGVCTWSDWPYDAKKPGRLTPERQRVALDRPLGAYYRVRHLYLNQMQAALTEAGVLYGSAQVHEGWQNVGKDGVIPYSKKLIGGHAFAIVGYDRGGFWIQNSWGKGWGAKGFCYIGYDDWLENAYDCWVARLGVPTLTLAQDQSLVRGRAAEFGYIPDDSVVLDTIRPHFVNLGNDGRFSQSGLYSSDEEDVRGVVLAGFKETSKNWSGPRRLAIYCHGGLNDEKASAARIASLGPYFLDNEIYPLHFMWETGFLDSVRGIVQDAFRRGRFQGWTDTLRDRFYDLLDEGIELAARPLGRPVWAQIKDNAARASGDGGGATFTAAEIAACFAELGGKAELHLVGHSAGSIFIAHLLEVLDVLDLPVKSLTLFAPACTLDLFEARIARHIGPGENRRVERYAQFNLADSVERDDSVGPAYHKSLLYLVSESFEPRHRAPLLGMEAFIDPKKKMLDALPEADRRQIARVKRAIGAPKVENGKTVIRAQNVPANLKLESCSLTHGGFDNDEATLNSMLKIITGKPKPSREF